MKKYLTVLGAIALLGAGCPSPATPASTTPPTAVNPESRCDALLTLDEAKQVSGTAYTKRDATSQNMGKIVVTTCTYYDTVTKSGIKPISFLTRYATSAAEAKNIFEQSKTATYTDGRSLAGIGEEALWSATFSQVSAIQGQTWLIVTANKNEELATKFAKAIAPKLK
jgi:hypothetical protein